MRSLNLNPMDLGRLQGIWLAMRSMNIDIMDIPAHVQQDCPSQYEIQHWINYENNSNTIRIINRKAKSMVKYGQR